MAARHDELPAVSRRQVRLALRSAREAIGQNQTDVAKSLGWSLSKLQRIELGEVTISPTDLQALLKVYGITDEERVAALLKAARVARRERYWTAQEHREHLSAGLLQLIQFELAATAIRDFQPSLVSGLLQTPATVDAIFAGFGRVLSEAERRVRGENRLARRHNVIEREDRPDYFLMIDESVLWRPVGGLQATAEQFEDLANTSDMDRIHIRVLPMDTGALLGAPGTFMVVDLSDKPDDAVLYKEHYLRDELVQDALEVSQHREIFERFWRRALDEAASRALILARAYELRARIARAESDVEGGVAP